MKKGKIVHASLGKITALQEIIKAGAIGINPKAIGFQIPPFKEIPLVYCSFVCEGYPQVYGNYPGITFETDSKLVYACPSDNFNLMRGGRFLPGHERFVFSSVEEMLDEYPTTQHFKQAFQKYFKTLDHRELYPHNEPDFSESLYRQDYALCKNWNPGCNEITFPKPLKITDPQIFKSIKEIKF